MRKFPNINMFLKLFPLTILLALVVFGCSAQKKPAPPTPQAKLIPSESNIGFTELDQSLVPASVKKIISAMTGVQTAAWSAVGNNNYIILNPEDKNETVKISEVIQRVPDQNFVWLDVKLLEGDLKEDQQKEGQKTDQSAQVKVYKLAKTDKAVNGVGFEYKETEEAKPEAAAQNQPAPSPAPVPAPKPTPPVPPAPDLGPVQPLKPVPEKKQPTPSDQTDTDQQPEIQVPGGTGNQGANQ